MTDGTNESTVDTLEILEEGMTVEKAIGKCNDDKSIASSSTVDSTAGPVLDGKDEEDEGCLVWRILGLIALIILYAALIPVSCWALLILYDEQVLSGAVILGHFLIVLFAGGISIGVVHLTEFLLYLQLALRGVPFRSYNQMGCYLYYKTGYGNLNLHTQLFLTTFFIAIICKYCFFL